jgi:NAD(P)H-hydrate epimerase
VYASALPEILTLGLPESSNGELSKDAFEDLLKACERKNALVIGPGLGLSEDVKSLLFALLERVEIPVVLDADALTLIAEDLDVLKKCRIPKILTPHPGEAARLLKTSKEELLADRLYYSRRLAELSSSIVVFKGPHTLVCEPSGKCSVSSIDEPGLSQGGTGDVLAGVIGSLLAQGYTPFEAACLGVFLHGYSGTVLREKKGPWGYTATEVANFLPQVIKELKENPK